PFCGVGCLLTYHVKENKIQFVTGKDGPSNHGRLCVKGRDGFDYAHQPHRLTKPLIRKEEIGKAADFVVDPGNWSGVFREASWEEALELAGAGLRGIRDQDRYALAGFGSAKGSNEEAYLFQKLVRTGFGTNNVDHCTRLCHASSVAALMEGINSGAVSNQVNDVMKENAKNFSPEAMAPVCGIPAGTIREVARAYATSKGSMILWGMGISQHVHGTDNARCLIALALMTGQIGRPGTGLHPLRG